jgi:malate dehydrogenase (oxaloacetate-decarboxylating)(NADP+)
MDEFMNEFMEAMREVFPQLLVQFEDFSTDNAFRYLDMFRHKYRCFNDDVRFIRCPILPDFSTIYMYIYRFKALVSCYFSHTFYFDLTDRKGSVVLSGFINAARLSSSAAGTPLTDQRILFFGAGSAGVGVAKQLMSFFTLLGLSEEEARSRIYVSNRGFLFFFAAAVLIKLNSLDCRFEGINYCR